MARLTSNCGAGVTRRDWLAALLALPGASLFAGAVAPARPLGVVADYHAFPKEKLRAILGAKVTFLAPGNLAAIRNFSAKGGKLVVAYSGDAALGQFMGVQPGPWRRLECVALGSGRRILSNYKTGCAFVPAIPKGNPHHARVVATMRDALLRDTGIVGAIETDRGIWYAHGVPPPAMTGGMLERLPATLTVRGVWSAGTPLAPGGWRQMAAKLAATGFNAVFLRSDSAYFGQALAECHKVGLKVHAWMLVFETGKRVPTRKDHIDAAVAAAAQLAGKGVDGIQFDYLRYPSGSLKDTAQRLAGMRAITGVLRRLSAAVRAKAPALTLSAAVYPVPRTQQAVGQNVPEWLRCKYVDFVAPMAYSSNDVEFSGWLAENLAAIPPARLVIGVGSGANESRLDNLGIKRQLGMALARHLHGGALFALDAELAARLLG